MPDPRHRLGQRAETAVAGWLASEGWTVLARRWRVPEGELDIVALDPAGALVGVEVRARRTSRTGTPAETVGRAHLIRLQRALLAYASRQAAGARRMRVDLVTMRPERPVTADDPPLWRAKRLAGIDAW
jgi:putative endonuclease